MLREKYKDHANVLRQVDFYEAQFKAALNK
jgi:hypothetical protein